MSDRDTTMLRIICMLTHIAGCENELSWIEDYYTNISEGAMVDNYDIQMQIIADAVAHNASMIAEFSNLYEVIDERGATIDELTTFFEGLKGLRTYLETQINDAMHVRCTPGVIDYNLIARVDGRYSYICGMRALYEDLNTHTGRYDKRISTLSDVLEQIHVGDNIVQDYFELISTSTPDERDSIISEFNIFLSSQLNMLDNYVADATC